MQTAALAGLGLTFGCGPTPVAERAAPSPWASAMSSTVSSTVSSVPPPAAIVAPARCVAPATADAKTLVPDTMVAMGQLDVAATFKGVLGSTIKDAMASSGVDLAKQFAKCKLPASGVSRVTLGVDDDSDSVLVLEAPTLGTDATLDCVHDAIADVIGTSPWTKTRAACTTALEIAGEPTRAYVAGPNMVVLATKKMDKAVRAQLKGSGKSALHGRLRWAPKAVDTGKAFWAAMVVPKSMGTELKRLTVSADTGAVLDLHARLTFNSVRMATEIGSQASTFSAMGPMLGIPSTMMKSFQVDVDGATVSLGVEVSRSDLDALKKIAGDAGIPLGGAKTPKVGI